MKLLLPARLAVRTGVAPLYGYNIVEHLIHCSIWLLLWKSSLLIEKTNDINGFGWSHVAAALVLQ
jgi:hypothetical protein